MISDGKLKQNTKIVFISVIALTLIVLNVSYSAFFTVKSQENVQELTTGSLNVVVNNTKAITGKEMFPTENSKLPTAEDSVATGDYAELTLDNQGDLDADFSVTLSYDDASIPENQKSEEKLSLEHLKIGIHDETANKWVNFGDENNKVYSTTITALTSTGDNSYPILRDNVTSKNKKQYKVYLWLAEDTPTSEIGKLIYLKLDIKSATINGRDEKDNYEDPSLAKNIAG